MHEANIEIFGSVTVGPKGQIVIPKNIRKLLDVEPGDRLISVIAYGKYIGFARSQDCEPNIKI